jgi:hypothetical protein
MASRDIKEFLVDEILEYSKLLDANLIGEVLEGSNSDTNEDRYCWSDFLHSCQAVRSQAIESNLLPQLPPGKRSRSKD